MPLPSLGDLPNPGAELVSCISCVSKWILHLGATREAQGQCVQILEKRLQRQGRCRSLKYLPLIFCQPISSATFCHGLQRTPQNHGAVFEILPVPMGLKFTTSQSDALEKCVFIPSAPPVGKVQPAGGGLGLSQEKEAPDSEHLAVTRGPRRPALKSS